MGGLPVDSDVQADILLPPLKGGSHTVEVIQVSFCLALLHNATGVVNISLPMAGLQWGGV